MFQKPAERGGLAAHTISPLHLHADDPLRTRLREHVQRLKLIIPVISVSVLALKAQNAELDEDIASLLDLHANAPLDVEVYELEALLADDFVDQILGGDRQRQAGDPADEHQEQTEEQAATACPDQRPRFSPGRGPLNLLLGSLRVGHVRPAYI